MESIKQQVATAKSVLLDLVHDGLMESTKIVQLQKKYYPLIYGHFLERTPPQEALILTEERFKALIAKLTYSQNAMDLPKELLDVFNKLIVDDNFTEFSKLEFNKNQVDLVDETLFSYRQVFTSVPVSWVWKRWLVSFLFKTQQVDLL